MTKPVTLESKIEQFRDALCNPYTENLADFRYGIPDFQVMLKLGCSPQSWARYRPKLIQYCLYNDLIKTEVIDGISMETVRICMRYDKKAKEWYGKRNPLMIDDKENNTWREMTEEEIKKYQLFWFPEGGFLY